VYLTSLGLQCVGFGFAGNYWLNDSTAIHLAMNQIPAVVAQV
jgi:hypothetical protein